jgi:hypothetical protein
MVRRTYGIQFSSFIVLKVSVEGDGSLAGGGVRFQRGVNCL